jgi:50S ribosomal subunit-associated GTPase HflX
MNELVDRISDFVRKDSVTVQLRIPAARADLLARLHREGIQGAIHYEEESTLVTATIPTSALDHFAPFLAGAAVVGKEVATAPVMRDGTE